MAKEVNKDIQLNPSDFEFMQAEEKIYDKKFETKPIGYFKDAMIRFSKNKTNVVASIILFILIFLAILIPIVTTKNYTALQEQISHLPPRVPYIEKLGFLDGTRKLVYQPVDRSTIDPDTGIGLPRGVNPEYIRMETLVNYTESCVLKSVDCFGGENIMSLDRTSTGMTIQSAKQNADQTEIIPATFDFDGFLRQYIVLDIVSFPTTGNPRMKVLVDSDNDGIFEEIGTVTEAGVHEFRPYDVLTTLPPEAWNQAFTTAIRVRFESDVPNLEARIRSLSITHDAVEEPTHHFEGFTLSIFNIVAGQGAGRYVRINGEMIFADYRFDSYQALFGERNIQSLPGSQYNNIVAEYGCVQVPDPDNPNGWLFEEGCPIIKVNSVSEPIVVGGVPFISYNVIVLNAFFLGYDDVPYFLFGTTDAGRDLFALSWVALRTSLLIGLIVASINITIGVVYGSIAGYYGGKTDLIMERFSEIIARIPWLVTLSIFVALIGTGFWTLVLILIVSGWIGVASVTRTQFYRYKRREYVLASRTLGAKDGRLIFRHILPNGIGTIITASILMIPGVIFAESTISYLGYGIGHGQVIRLFGLRFSGVSLGVLLADGRNDLLERPYLTVFPSIIISILMITFNMFGNALRDAFNPSLRGSK